MSYNGCPFKLKPYVEKKVWGREVIYTPLNSEYTGKILEFDEGASSSCHFHVTKRESFFIMAGEFEITFIKDGKTIKSFANVGDRYDIWPGLVHKVKCIKAGYILEASTRDSSLDNYRIDLSSAN